MEDPRGVWTLGESLWELGGKSLRFKNCAPKSQPLA